MWASYAIALFCVIALLYIPGTLINKACRFDTLLSCILAPVTSCLCIAVVATLLYVMPIPLNGIALFAAMLAISLLAFIVSLTQSRKNWETSTVPSADLLSRLPRSMTMYSMMGVQSIPSNWLILIIYVVVAAAFCLYMFLGGIEWAATAPVTFAIDPSYLQVGSFAEAGVFSFVVSATSPLTGEAVFAFQSLWQIIPEIISSLTAIDPGICLIATLSAFIAFVLPIGVFGLLGILFHKSRLFVCLGAVFAMSFGAMPWHMLLFVSQLGAFMAVCFVPYAFIAILGFTIQSSNMRSKLVYAFILFATVISIIVSYAHILFVFAVMGAPYLISRYFCWVNDFGKFKKPVLAKIMGALAYICACFIIWAIFCNLPFAQTVDPAQGAFMGGFLEALEGIGLLALIPTAGSQILLGLICLLGAVVLLFKKGFRWMVVTWGVCVLFFLLFAVLPAPSLSHAFGFWYMPPGVMAALLSIASIPLAAAFSDVFVRGIVSAISSLANIGQSRALLALVGVVFLAAFIACDVFVASISFSGGEQTSNSLALIHDALRELY